MSKAELLRVAARILDEIGDDGVTAESGLSGTLIVAYSHAAERVRARLPGAVWTATSPRLSRDGARLERDLLTQVDGVQVCLYGAVSVPLPDLPAAEPLAVAP